MNIQVHTNLWPLEMAQFQELVPSKNGDVLVPGSHYQISSISSEFSRVFSPSMHQVPLVTHCNGFSPCNCCWNWSRGYEKPAVGKSSLEKMGGSTNRKRSFYFARTRIWQRELSFGQQIGGNWSTQQVYAGDFCENWIVSLSIAVQQLGM